MSERKRAVVAGHICLDITPVFPEEKGAAFSSVFSPGTLTNVGPAQLSPGGAVANTGQAMALFGADVTLMGKVGDDPLGRTLLSLLGSREGMIVSPGAATSYSVVLALPGSDRFFLHCPGANDTFCAGDLNRERLRGASHFHFGYPPLMRRLYEDGGEELARIFSLAKEAGLSTSLDLASVEPDSPAGRADWEGILSRVLPLVDFFTPSAEELCYMLDRPRFARWREQAGGSDPMLLLRPEEDIAPLAERAGALEAKAVLIKCGAPGLLLRTGDAQTMSSIPGLEWPQAWAGLSLFEKSYRPSVLRSATGAGDVSIAAFLAALLEGCPPQECLRLAAGAGASCVEGYDALSALLPFPALREKIAAGWEKQAF